MPRIVVSLLIAAVLSPVEAEAQRVCMEELAGTCLKYADPPAAAQAPRASAAPAAPVSAEEQAERALGLGPEERRRAQSGLRAAGHYNGVIDGAIGPASRRAIASWQRAEGIQATGFLTSEQVSRLSALAVTGGGAEAAPAATTSAPASAERDRARAEEVIGVTCYFTAFGTPFDMKFGARGRAVASYIEGQADFDWKLENDRLCLFGDMVRGESCVELPAAGGGERAMLEGKARELCRTFQMRRPPGQL